MTQRFVGEVSPFDAQTIGFAPVHRYRVSIGVQFTREENTRIIQDDVDASGEREALQELILRHVGTPRAARKCHKLVVMGITRLAGELPPIRRGF